jgi:ketosteroid isomerase-like protein
MSHQNVEIVEWGLDAFNRLDTEILIGLVTLDCEWFPAMAGVIEGDAYRGIEGVERYVEEVRNTWEELHIHADDVRDLGDRVLVLGRADARGRGSGVRVSMPLGMVYEFRGGKISRAQNYLDPGAALRAARLAG